MAAAAGLALALVLVLLTLPFRHTVRLARRLGRRDLAAAWAEALVGAVRHAARWWPGRAACMETSLGAVLAATPLGRRLDWCLGARFAPPPVEYYAWAELPGHGPDHARRRHTIRPSATSCSPFRSNPTEAPARKMRSAMSPSSPSRTARA
ncbi:lasso peptide biosynthesis B2 protein [Streptomyces glaucescens]|uniref:lasso peptide biosynthesis B2 protein n=1 Tax=Streptomyces glaucescens TaxID=1907 RepID=UPI000D1B7524